jgi:flagellar protein FliL
VAESGATTPAKSSGAAMFMVVMLALVGGAGATWLLMQRSHAAESARGTDHTAPLYIVRLEGFTVNLADTEEAHFLRVTMDLGVGHVPDSAEKDKTGAAMPVARIRDAVLAVLTMCKADALLTSEGKAQLKKNILEALQHNVPELDVRDVYFTEFLVQR